MSRMTTSLERARRCLLDKRLQGMLLLLLCFILLLLQYSISWGLLCVCELLLFSYAPKRRAVVDVALAVLPGLVFATYFLYAVVQGTQGMNGDVLSDMFFSLVAVALLFHQRYAQRGSEALEMHQAQRQDAPGCSRGCCACCSCCGILVGISLTSQVVGMLVYLASSPRPAYSSTSIAYWCMGGPNESLVVLEPGYMASAGTLYFVQQALSLHTRVCIYDQVGVGFSSGHSPSFRSDAAAMKDPDHDGWPSTPTE